MAISTTRCSSPRANSPPAAWTTATATRGVPRARGVGSARQLCHHCRSGRASPPLRLFATMGAERRLRLVHAYLTAWDTTITPIEDRRASTRHPALCLGVRAALPPLGRSPHAGHFLPAAGQLGPVPQGHGRPGGGGWRPACGLHWQEFGRHRSANQQTGAELRRHLVLLEVEPTRVVNRAARSPPSGAECGR